jgi:hypothetical protein
VDRKNDHRDALHGFLLRNSDGSYVAGKIADGVRPPRIGEFDLMAAGRKLSRQHGADVSSADDPDFHGMFFRECGRAPASVADAWEMRAFLAQEPS